MTSTACDDQLRSRCQVCGIEFARPRQADVPDGYCTRCWKGALAFTAEQDALADAWDRDKAITDIAVAMSPDNWPEGHTIHHKGHDITWEEYVTRRHELEQRHELEEESTVEPWPEERMDAIGTNGPTGDHYAEDGLCVDGHPCGRPVCGDDAYCMGCPNYAEDSDGESALSQVLRETTKQARYQDAEGDDWIDEFARTATAEEFRGAMRFTIGKYVRRVGRKDAELSEVRKMRDYCQRWEAYLLARGRDD